MWKSLAVKILGSWPLRRLLAFPVRRQLARFEAATQQPRETQEALLRRILTHQANTGFGRDHGFGQIRQVVDFRRQIPVAGYERIEPYIARVRQGDIRALVADPVVHMFALTSGTTATRKFIPVTAQYLADYRRGWNLWGLKVYLDHRKILLRSIVQMSGDWDEFRTEAGIPCGAITGLTALMQKRFVRWMYCVPACTGRIKDTAAKLYTVLRLSLPRRVGMIIAANPSTLVNLARAADAEKETLIRDIADGTLSLRLDIPADVRAELATLLRPDPKRAQELESAANRHGRLYPCDCWPPDRLLIGTWTGGTVGAYLRHFPRYYGADTIVRDVGLIASEGRMTIPLADGTSSGVLDITSHYFEFIPEEEGDSAQPTVLAAHELQEGRHYYILPTTAFGLYRYHIHDLVRVTGFHNQTPLIEFLSKGAHFANVTGEKLSEYQVVQAMKEVSAELSLAPVTYSLAPCWDDDRPFYGLFLERSDLPERDRTAHLVGGLDRRLAEINTEYAAKRGSLRLDPIRLQPLPPGTWQRWDRERLARSGGTPEQYKHPCLIADIAFRDSMPVEAASEPQTLLKRACPGKPG
jgi:hypothetical protein